MISKENMCAKLDGSRVVITLEVDDIQQMVINANACFGLIPMKITDARKFAETLVSEMNMEGEDGTTPLHQFFDVCAGNAYQWGEGCEDIDEDDLAGLDEFNPANA